MKIDAKQVYPLAQIFVRKTNIPTKPTVIITTDTFMVVHQFNPLEGKFIVEGDNGEGLVCECEDIDNLLDCINIVLNNKNKNLLELFHFK